MPPSGAAGHAQPSRPEACRIASRRLSIPLVTSRDLSVVAAFTRERTLCRAGHIRSSDRTSHSATPHGLAHWRLPMSTRVKLAIALAFVVGLPVLAVSTKFSYFIPLASSAPALPIDGSQEATPITLSNPKWSQRTVADRRMQNQLVLNSNSGNWDMITSNETGPSAGRYLFMPFETGTAGVQRVDLQNPHYDQRTVTIVAPGEQGFVSGDASRWTPWGGYLTAEESWGAGSVKGRLFEVTNPITAGPNGGNFVWRSIVPRVSHEGLAFDKNNTLYFVDEFNGGSIYKYVSMNPHAASGDEYFAAGQTYALRVGAGGQFEGNNGPAITGIGTWVAITDEVGGAIPGVSTVNPDGT